MVWIDCWQCRGNGWVVKHLRVYVYIYVCTMYVYTTMYNGYFNTRTINIVLFFLRILFSILPELAHKT